MIFIYPIVNKISDCALHLLPRDGAAVARLTHYQKVAGSNPALATA